MGCTVKVKDSLPTLALMVIDAIERMMSPCLRIRPTKLPGRVLFEAGLGGSGRLQFRNRAWQTLQRKFGG